MRRSRVHVQDIYDGPGGSWAKVTCVVPAAFVPIWQAAHDEYRLRLLEEGLETHAPGPVANGMVLEALAAEFLAGAPCRAAR